MCLTEKYRCPINKPYIIAYKLMLQIHDALYPIYSKIYNNYNSFDQYKKERWQFARYHIYRHLNDELKLRLINKFKGFHACKDFKTAAIMLNAFRNPNITWWTPSDAILKNKQIGYTGHTEDINVNKNLFNVETTCIKIFKVILKSNLQEDIWQVRGNEMRILEKVKD